MVLAIIVLPAIHALEVLHRFDVLDEVWFIRRASAPEQLLSVPVHCKRARCFDMSEMMTDVNTFVRGLMAMHTSCKPPTMATMLLGGWLDLQTITIYSLGAKIEAAIPLDEPAEDADADPLDVSDFSTDDSSSMTE